MMNVCRKNIMIAVFVALTTSVGAITPKDDGALRALKDRTAETYKKMASLTLSAKNKIVNAGKAVGTFVSNHKKAFIIGGAVLSSAAVLLWAYKTGRIDFSIFTNHNKLLDKKTDLKVNVASKNLNNTNNVKQPNIPQQPKIQTGTAIMEKTTMPKIEIPHSKPVNYVSKDAEGCGAIEGFKSLAKQFYLVDGDYPMQTADGLAGAMLRRKDGEFKVGVVLHDMIENMFDERTKNKTKCFVVEIWADELKKQLTEERLKKVGLMPK